MYAIIAEKTGWTPQHISQLNLDTVRILLESWAKLAKSEPTDSKPKPSSTSDIMQFKALADSVR